MNTSGSLLKRTFDKPDETRPAGSGKADIINAGKAALMRMNLPPGWKWSKDVKPIVHTESCQATHFGHVLSGQMHVVMNDGTEADLGPGDVFVIEPGHDSWVVGSEPFVSLDVTGYEVWAKPR